jgi:NitT/TauT family transport system ATP-binding protein
MNAGGIELAAIRMTFASEGRPLVVLDGFDLTISPGEFVCLVGPSGCGKTTLLHLIAGLRRPVVGTIHVSGKEVRGPGADRGMVFQDYALFPWRTVVENVEFGPKIRGVPAETRRRKAIELIRLTGLAGFERSYPHELSGGMRQRVAVARALANDPDVLLMDEPFASVDALTRLTLQEELTRVWSVARTTVVFVTHSVDEAVFLADRVIAMTARPSRVATDLRVDLERPRKWADLEHDQRFARLKGLALGAVTERNVRDEQRHV